MEDRQHFSSGNWVVKGGSEQEFISRWRAWIARSTEGIPGFGSALLMQDTSDLAHFVSVSDWSDPKSRATWQGSSAFAEGLASCRELCDDFQGRDYSKVEGVGGV
jgi:heme-degrading monooxygenase HmoA